MLRLAWDKGPRQSGHVPGPAQGVVMVATQCGPNFVSTPDLEVSGFPAWFNKPRRTC
jgi:hypothetical protein